MKLRLVAAATTAGVLLSMDASADEATAVMRLEPDPADAVAALQLADANLEAPGSADMQCIASADGALTGCRLLGENPSGSRLGEAALSLAPNYRASRPGDLRVTVSFKAFVPARRTERPDASLFMRALRKAGIQGDPNGKAQLDCLVGTDGRLISCRVVSSTPTPQYGAAGMMVASNFRFRPATYGGTPVQSRTKIPLNFDRGWS